MIAGCLFEVLHLAGREKEIETLRENIFLGTVDKVSDDFLDIIFIVFGPKEMEIVDFLAKVFVD